MPSPDVAKQRINYCSLLNEERWSQKSTSPHRDMKSVCKGNAETSRDFLCTDDVTGVSGKGSEKRLHTVWENTVNPVQMSRCLQCVEDVNTLFRNINTWKTHVLPFPQMNTNRIPQIQTWRQIAFSQIALSKGGTAQVVTNIQFTGWLMETEEWRMVSSLSFRFSVSGNVTWKKK